MYALNVDNMDIKLLNPLTLAYMGDAVLDQHVREYIVLKLQSKPNRLHQVSKSYVSAKSQAQTLETLFEMGWFTDEELDIVKEVVMLKVTLRLKIRIFKLIVKVLV